MKNLKSVLLTLSIGAFAVASYGASTALTVGSGVTKDIFGEIYVDSNTANNWYGDENYTKITVNSGGTLNIEDWSNLYLYSQSDYSKGVNTLDVAGTLNFNVSDPLTSSLYILAGRTRVTGTLNSNATMDLGGDGKAYFLVTGSTAKATVGDVNVAGGAYSNIRVEYGGTFTCNDMFLHQNSTETQAVLSMNHGGTINAKSITAGNNALIQIGNGVINVNDISVAGQSKNEKGKLELGEGAILNINGGNNSVLAGVTVAAGATININAGKVQTYGDNAFFMTGAVLNLANGTSLHVADAALLDENNNYTFCVARGITNEINLKGSAYMHTASSQGGNDFKVGNYSGGQVKVKITAGRQGAIVSDKLTLVDNGGTIDATVYLNSKNIFVGSKAYDSDLGEFKENFQNDFANFNTMVVLGSSTSGEFVVNADSAFGQVSWQKNCELVLTLGESGVISFSEFVQGYAFENSSSAKLTINEFENNRIFIQNMEEVGVINGTKQPGFTVSISATLSDGYLQYEQNQNRKYTNSDFQMVAGEWNGVQGYWLNMPALVPEPAEWAMVFGAIALGLAMYRRRK